MPVDLHELPKLRDSLSYIYIEHAVVDRSESAIEFFNKDGKIRVPVASLCVLMLGPGTRITHAAICALAANGCSVLWVGQDTTRFYACGTGETRKSYHLLHQANLVCNECKRTEVVLRMYKMRFGDELDPSLSLPQIRGLEGVRVRTAYSEASKETGVHWEGRNYDRKDWIRSDPINRALSAANAILNALCHSAIISGGYSPALGFIHTGKQLSFVYDVADLYKVEFTIPTAFEIIAESNREVEKRVRSACRERFHMARLLDRILPDIDRLLELPAEPTNSDGDVDKDPGLPEELWRELWSDSVEGEIK